MKTISFIIIAFSIFSMTSSAQITLKLERSGDQEAVDKYKKNAIAKMIDELDEKIEIDQGNADLYIQRAANFAELNDKKAVLKDVNTALLLKPNDIDLLYEGAQQLYLSGQYEESIKIGNFLLSMNDRCSSLGNKIRYLNEFKIKDYKRIIEDIIKSGDFF